MRKDACSLAFPKYKTRDCDKIKAGDTGRYVNARRSTQYLLLDFVTNAVSGARDRFVQQLSKAPSDVADPHRLDHFALRSTGVGAQDHLNVVVGRVSREEYSYFCGNKLYTASRYKRDCLG